MRVLRNSKTAVVTVKQTPREKLKYVRRTGSFMYSFCFRDFCLR